MLSGQQEHVTRFIALANVGNPDKKKRVSLPTGNSGIFGQHWAEYSSTCT